MIVFSSILKRERRFKLHANLPQFWQTRPTPNVREFVKQHACLGERKLDADGVGGAANLHRRHDLRSAGLNNVSPSSSRTQYAKRASFDCFTVAPQVLATRSSFP